MAPPLLTMGRLCPLRVTGAAVTHRHARVPCLFPVTTCLFPPLGPCCWWVEQTHPSFPLRHTTSALLHTTSCLFFLFPSKSNWEIKLEMHLSPCTEVAGETMRCDGVSGCWPGPVGLGRCAPWTKLHPHSTAHRSARSPLWWSDPPSTKGITR